MKHRRPVQTFSRMAFAVLRDDGTVCLDTIAKSRREAWSQFTDDLEGTMDYFKGLGYRIGRVEVRRVLK